MSIGYRMKRYSGDGMHWYCLYDDAGKAVASLLSAGSSATARANAVWLTLNVTRLSFGTLKEYLRRSRDVDAADKALLKKIQPAFGERRQGEVWEFFKILDC